MKKLATILLILGLALFAAGMAVAAMDSNSAGAMQIIGPIALCLGGALTCIALFMLSRAREGVRILEITEKDRTQLREMRRELVLRRILGRLLVSFGALFILTGLLYPFFEGSPHQVNWAANAGLVLVGSLMVFAAVRLTKTSK